MPFVRGEQRESIVEGLVVHLAPLLLLHLFSRHQALVFWNELLLMSQDLAYRKTLSFDALRLSTRLPLGHVAGKRVVRKDRALVLLVNREVRLLKALSLAIPQSTVQGIDLLDLLLPHVHVLFGFLPLLSDGVDLRHLLGLSCVCLVCMNDVDWNSVVASATSSNLGVILGQQKLILATTLD